MEDTIRARVGEAIGSNVMAQAALLTAMATPAEQARWMAQKVVPLVASRVEPVIITDPACSSGTLLLGAAAALPRWLVGMGLVRFCGTDMSPRCVAMARLNLALHHMSGEVRCADGLDTALTAAT